MPLNINLTDDELNQLVDEIFKKYFNFDAENKIYINHKFPINTKMQFRLSYLSIAAICGDIDLIHFIIKAGGDINHIDDFGNTAILWTVAAEDIVAFTTLVDAGANLALHGPGEKSLKALLNEGLNESFASLEGGYFYECAMQYINRNRLIAALNPLYSSFKNIFRCSDKSKSLESQRLIDDESSTVKYRKM